MSKNVPDRNAIGSTMKLAIALAASSVLAIDPTSSPIDRNASVPQTRIGDGEPPAVRPACSPNGGVSATPT